MIDTLIQSLRFELNDEARSQDYIDGAQDYLGKVAAAVATSHSPAIVKEAGEDDSGLPKDWAYWLLDGSRILRANGTEAHADELKALHAALSASNAAQVSK